MSSLIAIIHGDGSAVLDTALRQAIGRSRRGPDGHATWTDGPVGLAHSLLDVGGNPPKAQPATRDGELWIAADARIDDRGSLIRELDAALDVRSPSRSSLRVAADHELLLYAYRAWGRCCVDRLIGDFAFAIWDAAERRLFCARDQLGVVPLFYAAVDDRLIVASELDVIRSFPGVPDQLDDLAVADYLMCGLSMEPEATIFAAIRRLPAAHNLTWANGRVAVERYWELQVPPESASSSDPTAELEPILQVAVDDRLRGVSSAGIPLSGGVDSPLVAAIAKRRGNASSEPVDLRAGTTVFEHLIPDDEQQYAAIVAAALDLPIEYRPADRCRMFEGWDDSTRSWPEPAPNPTAALNVGLMRSLATHSRVALTGLDGDALCQTWLPSHFRCLIRSGQLLTAIREVRDLSRLSGSFPPKGATGIWAPTLARQRRRQAERDFPPWIDRGLVERLDLRDRWQRLHAPDRRWSRPPEADAVELHTGPGMRLALEECDPARTHASLDVRHPLLDLRVIEYVLALPPIPWKVDKAILRRLAGHSLPTSICERPKAPLQSDPVQAAVLAGLGPADAEIRSARTERYVNAALLPSPRSAAASGGLWPRLWATGLDLWLREQAKRQ